MGRDMIRPRIIICVWPLSMFFSACGAPRAGPPSPPTPEAPPVPVNSVLLATATSGPASISIPPSIPDALRQAGLASGASLAKEEKLASARLEIAQSIDVVEGHPVFTEGQAIWFYALVAPFPTVVDGVRYDELKQAWAGSQ